MSLYQVVGADEDNLILTRRVQRDLWVHQHPRDCAAPGVKFLVVNVSHDYYKEGSASRVLFLGVGAQLTVAAGFVSCAVKMDRVLVIDGYERAVHNGCAGENARALEPPVTRHMPPATSHKTKVTSHWSRKWQIASPKLVAFCSS